MITVNRWTYRKVIEVLGTGSEYSDSEFIDHPPKNAGISQRTAIVEHQRASEGQAADQEVPHHPSSEHVCGVQSVHWKNSESLSKTRLTLWYSRRRRPQAGDPRISGILSWLGATYRLRGEQSV